MYTALCDGNVLYDPRLDDVQIFNAKVKLEVNKVGTFDFTIYPSHPLYGSINKLKSSIEVYRDNTLIFRGRPLWDSVGLNKDKSFSCEGDLAFFNDSIMRPYDYDGSVSGFLQSIITSHNAQVETGKEFTLGTVTVTDPNNYITRSSIDYLSSWDTINSRLIGLLGGYIVVRRSGGVNYIDYLADSTAQSLQSIELGQNILDLIQEVKSDDIITALIPLGTKLQDAEGNETDARLTISSVNSGVDYVYSQPAVDSYGWIFGTQLWDDVTDANNLKTKATAQLATLINLGVSINLTAIDLSMIDVSIDDINLFEYVSIKSTPHGIDTSALVTQLEIDLLSPQNNKITLGLTYETFTERQTASDKAIRDIKNDYVTNGQVAEVRSSLITLSSNIEQTAEAIRTEVSQDYTTKTSFNQYQGSVSTQFTQTATDYTFLFNQATQSISTLDGTTQSQFSEIKNYIRFVNGDIVLGEVNNPLTLKIQNDRISFLQNGAEVAYFSDNKLYVYDGEFLNALKLGSFSFIPRSNGSLDFKKGV